MNDSTAIGIDLGKEGWLTVVGPLGRPLHDAPVPLLPDGSYDPARMLELVSQWGDCSLAVLEAPVTMPGQQSAKTGLSIGEGYGLWRMALVAAKVPHEIVAPRVWKRAMGCEAPAPGKTKRQEALAATGLDRNELRHRVSTLKRRTKAGETLTEVELQLLAAHKETGDRSADRRKAAKAASVEAACRLFPGVDWRASPKCTKPHDGKVESALIALYALRRMRGQA